MEGLINFTIYCNSGDEYYVQAHFFDDGNGIIKFFRNETDEIGSIAVIVGIVSVSNFNFIEAIPVPNGHLDS